MVGDTLKRVGHALGLVLVVGALVLAVLLATPGLVGAEASYVVYSDSMSPAIEAGDVIVVQSVEPADLTAGDVITFSSASRADAAPVTHRIVGVEDSGSSLQFETQGDANDSPDQALVDASQVRGTVWFTIPLVGHVVAFASTDAGLIVLVIVPALLFVANEVYSLHTDSATEEAQGSGGGLK